MKHKITSLLACVIAVLFFTNHAVSQVPFRYLSYVFPSDSLQGFDEDQAKKVALANGYFGSEYHVVMYSMKRDFINNKYGFTKSDWNSGFTKGGNSGSNAKGGSGNTINAAPCINEDFEASPTGLVTSTLAGWTLAEGQNQYLAPGGSCSMNGCCPTFPTNNAWVVNTPIAGDPVIGTVPNSPLGGTKVLKMNDNITNKGEVVRITQTFPVTANNALFQFAFMGALNGTGHTCCSQPYIRINLKDCAANVIACPQVSITPPGASCATVSPTGWTTNASGYSYTPAWMVRSIDLSAYIGSCITVQITVGDCDGWAHFGYAYVDCKCLPMAVCVNSVCFPAGNPVAAVAACGVTTATMVAPPGLAPYTWNGPAGSGITNNPNQTITTTMAGNYTLTMNPIGICTPITKTVSLTFGTYPTAPFTSTNSCTTYSFTNTGTGPPSIQTYSFIGAGAPATFTSTATTNVVNFAPSTTYTVYHTVTNPQLCSATTSMVITTPPGPNPAFTASPSFTQCFNSNNFTFNATTTTGTHTYNFAPTAGAPSSGFSSTYGPVNFSTAGTYTVTHTINSGGCTTAASSVIVVNINPTVTATYTPPTCPGGKGTLSGGGLGSYFWTGPNSFTSVATSPTVIPSASTIGIYTLTSNYLGCIGTATVNVTMPSAPAVTVTNNGPVCVGSTVTFSATFPSTGVSYFYWYKYQSTPYLYYYGGYNINPATMVVNSTTVAGTYTFYIGYTGCPTTTYTTNLVVAPPPVPTATNTGPYCAGQTIQLTGGGGAAGSTYTWSGPGGFTSGVQSPTIANASTANAGVYTLTVGVGTCKATKTTTVVISPSPTLTPGSNSPVCAGSTLSLTMNAQTSYTWTGPNSFSSNLQNPTIANVTSAAAGVYTITAANASGCKTTNTIAITVTTPTTSAFNTGPYCAGQIIFLTTPAATSYTWTGPGGFTSNAQSPTIGSATTTMSGVYTVTTTTGACKASSTTSVTVNALPTPTASNTGPYCPGNTIQLNGMPAVSYTWSGPASFSSNSQNPSIPSASVTNGGVYTLSVTNTNGCVGSTTTSVTVNPNPTPVVGSNSPVCLNSPLNLTASGGTSYAWSGPNGFTSGLQNPTVASSQTTNIGVYTVTVTALGCTNTGTINVNVLTPATSASNAGPYCAGQNIALTTPAANTYTWSGPGGFTSNAQNPTTGAATTLMAGTYNVLVTVGSCTASASTTVIVNPLPVPTANNTGPYCPGNTIQLNGSAATTYTWSGPSYSSNSQNPSIGSASVTNGGMYTLTVTDANGCSGSTTTSVTVNPTPNPIVGSNSPVCVNSPLSLTASGGTSYAWSGPNGFTSGLQNPTVASSQTTNIGVYTVTVIALGCTNTGTINVNVLTPATSASNTGPYCAGATINLSTPAANTYTWTGPGGFTSNAQNPTIGGSTTLMSGTYNLIATVGSCTASASTTVVVNALPTPTASNNSAICDGQTLNLSGSSAVTYTWSGPGFTSNSQSPNISSANATNSGLYTYSVTDANGCVNGTTTSVTVNPLPVVSVNNPTSCVNQPINLTSSGGATYAWSGPGGFTSTSQNPTIPSAVLSMGGAYTVTVTTALGCSSVAIANVGVITLPTPAIVSNTPCAGQVLSLGASGGATYSWSGPNFFTSSNQNPTISNVTLPASGVYTLTAFAGGCQETTTASVIVNPLPTPSASVSNPVCVGQPINFTGSGAVTYTWTGPGSYNSISQNPIITTAATSNAGLYTLTVTDANGCVNSTSAALTVNTLPVISVNSPTACVNQNFGLTSNGGTTYLWSGPGGYSSSAQNPNITNATSAMSGQYTVTVTDANNCVNTSVATVSIVALPIPSALTAGPVCVGQTLMLTSSGGTSYSWTGPNGFISSLQNPNISNASLNAGGVYNVIVTANTCTASATVGGTVNPLPTPVLNSNSPVCVGASINLNGAGGVNYAWNGPAGFSSSSQNPSIPASAINNGGNYTLTVTDANNCVNTAVLGVVVNPLPTAMAMNVSACQNANATLGASGGVSYTWSGPNGFTSTTQNPLITSVQPAGAGQYTVTVTDANGCANTAVATLAVNPAPTPNAQSNSPICLNQAINLTATGGVTYSWSGPNGFISNQQNPAFTANSMAYSGLYIVTVTDANGCTASASVNNTVNPLPTAVIVTGNNKGCAPICASFSVQSSASLANVNWILGDGSYSTGNNTAYRCYSAAGIYTISASVTDNNGCPGTAVYTVEVYPQPVADFNHSPLTPILNIDNDVTFTDASYGTPIVSWNWYFMNTPQYQSTEQNPHFMYTEPGMYAVALVVKSDKGCLDTLVRALEVGEDFGIYIPNAFTPNGDGLNEIFQPKGFGVVNYEMQIFDRWGEKIFETTEWEIGWDGTVKGKEGIAKEDSYTWRIKVTSVFGKAHEYTGHVTLIK